MRRHIEAIGAVRSVGQLSVAYRLRKLDLNCILGIRLRAPHQRNVVSVMVAAREPLSRSCRLRSRRSDPQFFPLSLAPPEQGSWDKQVDVRCGRRDRLA